MHTRSRAPGSLKKGTRWGGRHRSTYLGAPGALLPLDLGLWPWPREVCLRGNTPKTSIGLQDCTLFGADSSRRLQGLGAKATLSFSAQPQSAPHLTTHTQGARPCEARPLPPPPAPVKVFSQRRGPEAKGQHRPPRSWMVREGVRGGPQSQRVPGKRLLGARGLRHPASCSG